MFFGRYKKERVVDLYLKLLVNHSLTDFSQGYAGQRHLLPPKVIREQERISAAPTLQ